MAFADSRFLSQVMSTSGVVCIQFILKNVHSQRLVPVVIQNLSSKNKDLRRHCFEFLNEILVLWPTFTLERHIAILQQAIRAGLSDADQEARYLDSEEEASQREERVDAIQR